MDLDFRWVYDTWMGDEGETQAELIFSHFDKDGDGYLNEDEFIHFLESALNSNQTLHIQLTPTPKRLYNIFNEFDWHKNGLIDKDTFFRYIWRYWLKQIYKPVTVFIVVDVQNDFIDGSLALRNCPAKQDGLSVIEPINTLLDSTKFDVVVYSLDWHPEDHCSFIDNVSLKNIHESSQVSVETAKVFDVITYSGNPPYQQVLWPRHCVQNSWGSQLHLQLKIISGSLLVTKGTRSNIDSYSAFLDNDKKSKTILLEKLLNFNVTDVYVVGLAYDVCVKATAIDACESGFRTVVVKDCCAGVSNEGSSIADDELRESGVLLAQSAQVHDLINGKVFSLELALKAAKNLSSARNLANLKEGVVGV